MSKSVKLTFKINPYANFQNYAHFLFGLLCPLIYERDRLLQQGYTEFYISSCDIHDKLLKEVNLPEVKIVSREEHKNIKNMDHIEIQGCDDPWNHNEQVFHTARDFLLSWLSDEIKKEKVNFQDNSKKILIIQRAPPDPFYLSNQADHPDLSSGTDRRSIKNFNQLVDTVKAHHSNTCVSITNKSLAYQISLFQTVDIVVGQFGADLCNMIWCKDDTSIIEIYPKNTHLIPGYRELIQQTHENPRQELKKLDLIAWKKYGKLTDHGFGPDSEDWFRSYYKNLAEISNLRFFRIEQETNHSDVDINQIVEQLGKLI
jgi:hypothetical protein